MFKINKVDLGGPTPNIQLSINEINTDAEYVEIPLYTKYDMSNEFIRYMGYISIPPEDNRSDYEKWKDEYYYSYYPTPSLVEVEVKVSPSVKKIFIPYTLEHISKSAFKNLTGVEFVIDDRNYNYKVEDGKIVHKHTNEVIWPIK